MTTPNITAPDEDPTIYPEHLRDAYAPRPGAFAIARRLRAAVARQVWDLWVNNVAASPIWPGRVRRRMLNAAGMDIRTNGVSAHCRFTNANVQIGAYSYLNEGFFGDARGGIRIGERVGIGPRVMIITSTHKAGPAEQRVGAHVARTVTIGDGCAIASGAQVHAGVHLRTGSVVAAGSVLMRSSRRGAVMSGVPAQEVYNYESGQS